MEMLHYIFNKLPEEKLEEKSMYFFIPLVLRLVNDESARLRGMAGALITSLLRRLPDAIFSRLYRLTLGWYANTVCESVSSCKWASAHAVILRRTG